MSGFSLVSSTNKNDRHDITEILLKVVLNTTNLYRVIVHVKYYYTMQYIDMH